MQQAVTIHDVARAVGVSAMTVSRALGNKPGVSARTREQVREAARRLGYAMHPAAKSLAGGKLDTLGMLVPDVGSQYIGELVRGVGEALDKALFDLILYTTHRDPERERERIRHLTRGQADGLLAVLPRTIDGHIEALEEAQAPVVILDHRGVNTRLPCVGTTNAAGARAAVAHLVSLGHRRIGHITGLDGTHASLERERGYREALHEAGLPVDAALVRQGDFQQPRAFQATRALLALPDPPTAIFAANDVSACGAIEAVKDRGLSVPGDVSVVGFDDIPMATQIHPLLTTVRQPLFEMGATAARMLIAQVRGLEPLAPRVELPTELVIRASSGQRRP